MYKTLNFYNLTTVLLVVICVPFLLGCSSGNSSKIEASDSVKTDTLSINEKDNDEIESEIKTSNTTISDDLAEVILEAINYEFNLVETDQGYDYVMADIDNDGRDGDLAVLLTKEPNSTDYDFDTETFILILIGDEFGQFYQFDHSGDLGGESIQYKGFKKLIWENETLTYTHQSMRNHMEVDIKIVNIKTTLINKISICYYNSTSLCKDLFIASERNAVNLNELNVEFLDSLTSK